MSKPEDQLLSPFFDLLLVSTMTLATSDGDAPHAAPVYFAADDKLNLYFFSDDKSLHSQHIAQNPRAAAAIYPECQGWMEIHGLQLHGDVRLVESVDIWEAAWELYTNKFPFVKALKAVVASNQMYVFTPLWVRLVDNSKGFGYKREYKIPP